MSYQSIMPPEALEHNSPLPPVEVMSCSHGMLEGYRNDKGDFVVARLISTDPAAYLDSRYSPSSVITR